MISGLAIIVPVLVTLFVFQFAVGLLLDSVGPLADLLQNVAELSDRAAANVVAVTLLVLAVFVVGFAAESSRASGRIEDAFDNLMSSIPGFGAVYSSFSEMSELLLEEDTQSFQEVKLVEYPTEHSYCVGFVTADTAEHIETATDTEEMTTLYMPMGPNPVMGGFIIHVDDERVYDVDMTVQEGLQSIVTNGISVNEGQDAAVPAEQLPTGAESTQPTNEIPDDTQSG